MSDSCRLCAEATPLEDLKSIDDPDLEIEQKLNACCRWESLKNITDIDLPQQICIMCISQLNICWQFAENVAIAQQKLIQNTKNRQLNPSNVFNGGDQTEFCKSEGDYFDDNYFMDDFSIPTRAEKNTFEEINPLEAGNQIKNEPHEHSEDSQDSIEIGIRSPEDEMIEIPMFQDPPSNLLDLLTVDDRNDNGTIKDTATERLNLTNWMILQHQCYLCKICCGDLYKLKKHFKTEHPNERFQNLCNFCEPEKTIIKRWNFHEHTTTFHLPHLKYW